MEKSTFKRMSGTYRQEGDYFLPNLAVPESFSIGIWGQRRRQYLREHRKALYNTLLLSGRLNSHLADINQQADDVFSQLVEQMTEQNDNVVDINVSSITEGEKVFVHLDGFLAGPYTIGYRELTSSFWIKPQIKENK